METLKKGLNATTLPELLFPVEIRDEVMASNKEYSKRVVGIINGEEKLLNQCSDVYALVKNEDIFPNIEDVLRKNGIEYSATYQHIDNVRFYVNYRIEDQRFAHYMKGTNDKIMPMLRVRHSYNGLTKYGIVFGYFRLVCTNGLTIPVEEMKEFNLSIVGKHTEQINRSFDDLNRMLIKFVNNAELITGRIIDKYERLGGVWVEKPADRIIEVLNATGITIVDTTKFNTVNDILNRITKESSAKSGLGYNNRVNDFLIYNGINQYLNDGVKFIAAPEVQMEKDAKVLEMMMLNT